MVDRPHFDLSVPPEGFYDFFHQELALEERIHSLGSLAGSEGTQKVVKELEALIEAAKREEIHENIPNDFLKAAAAKIWQETHNLEPIMFLYEEFYPRTIDKEDPTSFPVGKIGFAQVMADIAADVQGPERSLVLVSAVRFITQHNPDLGNRIDYLAHFALSLHDVGLTAPARQISQSILELNRPFSFKEELEGLFRGV